MTKREFTQAEIDSCEIVQDGATKQYFVIVPSQSVPGQEYKVVWNAEYKTLQCLPHNGQPCKASENGRSCYHLELAVLAFRAWCAEQRAQRIAEAAAVEATPEYQCEQVEQAMSEAQRRMEAMIEEKRQAAAEKEAREFSREADKREGSARRRSGRKCYESRPFSLLK